MTTRIEEIINTLNGMSNSISKYSRINSITSQTQNLNRANVNSFIENAVEEYNEYVNEANDILAVEAPDKVGAIPYYVIERKINSNEEEVLTARLEE